MVLMGGHGDLNRIFLGGAPNGRRVFIANLRLEERLGGADVLLQPRSRARTLVIEKQSNMKREIGSEQLDSEIGDAHYGYIACRCTAANPFY